jgi:hypothetical protein
LSLTILKTFASQPKKKKLCTMMQSNK